MATRKPRMPRKLRDCLIVFTIAVGLFACLASCSVEWSPVPHVDPAQLLPDLFTDNELLSRPPVGPTRPMAYYLAHLQHLAEAVVESFSIRYFFFADLVP